MYYRIDTILQDMPSSVKAYTVENPDLSYTVVLNSRLSGEENRRSFEHELSHIISGDFSGSSAEEAEINVRKRNRSHCSSSK